MQAQRSKGDARVDNFIQITVLCPPKPRVRAFVYRNAEKVKVYWTCTLNPASGGGGGGARGSNVDRCIEILPKKGRIFTRSMFSDRFQSRG